MSAWSLRRHTPAVSWLHTTSDWLDRGWSLQVIISRYQTTACDVRTAADTKNTSQITVVYLGQLSSISPVTAVSRPSYTGVSMSHRVTYAFEFFGPTTLTERVAAMYRTNRGCDIRPRVDRVAKFMFMFSLRNTNSNHSELNQMAILYGMSTIQYSARSARLYPIGGSSGLPKSSTQTASRSLQPFLHGLLGDKPDRQTDKSRYTVGNNRWHLRMQYCDVV